MAKKKWLPPIAVVAGDYVLVGRPGITMPADWFIAKVLWTDSYELLTEHVASRRFRQVLTIGEVVKVGAIATLTALQQEACNAVGIEQRAVREADRALGKARAAVWAKLDELWTVAHAEPAASEVSQ